MEIYVCVMLHISYNVHSMFIGITYCKVFTQLSKSFFQVNKL